MDEASSQNKPTIILYTAFSPNGHKIAVTLEELKLPYTIVPIDLPAIQHKEPWFLAINPNGRIPALTDRLDDGREIRLFESGSIMQYLVERYDTEHRISYGRGSREGWEVNNWGQGLTSGTAKLFFQNAGIGPMQGQANHFLRYNLSTEPEIYSRDRYINETRRLYRTLDKHFQESKSEYLVGNKCTIADIAISCWANVLGFAGIDINEFPHVKTWQNRMAARPAVAKGYNTPKKVDLDSLSKDPEKFRKYLKTNEAWIRHGMEEDAKK